MNKKVDLQENIVERCPLEIKVDLDKICEEIKTSYLSRFKDSNPEEYLEYSKGWHYILAEKITECKNIKKVLDIGALFGVMSVYMAKNGMAVTSLDGYVDEIPDDIKLKYNLKFLFENLESEEYPILPENYYDLVLMSEILEHLNYNPVPVLLMIRKALKRNGYLIINTPDDDNYPPIEDGPVARRMHHLEIPLYKNGDPRQSFPHSKQYKLDEFYELLKNCGFGVQEMIRFNYEGVHMLAITKRNESWKPSIKVIGIMNQQFPKYQFNENRLFFLKKIYYDYFLSIFK